jgi:hypothetical protein
MRKSGKNEENTEVIKTWIKIKYQGEKFFDYAAESDHQQ